MKVDGVRNSGAPGAAQRPAQAAPGFAPAAQSSAAVQGAVGVRAAPSLDAVLALQGGAEPDRRSKQARRGRRILDALDRVRDALLSGAAPATLREELRALGRQTEASGDSGLDDLMREIETRAAVELAKLDIAAGV